MMSVGVPSFSTKTGRDEGVKPKTRGLHCGAPWNTAQPPPGRARTLFVPPRVGPTRTLPAPAGARTGGCRRRVTPSGGRGCRRNRQATPRPTPAAGPADGVLPRRGGACDRAAAPPAAAAGPAAAIPRPGKGAGVRRQQPCRARASGHSCWGRNGRRKGRPPVSAGRGGGAAWRLLRLAWDWAAGGGRDFRWAAESGGGGGGRVLGAVGCVGRPGRAGCAGRGGPALEVGVRGKGLGCEGRGTVRPWRRRWAGGTGRGGMSWVAAVSVALPAGTGGTAAGAGLSVPAEHCQSECRGLRLRAREAVVGAGAPRCAWPQRGDVGTRTGRWRQEQGEDTSLGACGHQRSGSLRVFGSQRWSGVGFWLSVERGLMGGVELRVAPGEHLWDLSEWPNRFWGSSEGLWVMWRCREWLVHKRNGVVSFERLLTRDAMSMLRGLNHSWWAWLVDE